MDNSTQDKRELSKVMELGAAINFNQANKIYKKYSGNMETEEGEKLLNSMWNDKWNQRN